MRSKFWPRGTYGIFFGTPLTGQFAVGGAIILATVYLFWNLASLWRQEQSVVVQPSEVAVAVAVLVTNGGDAEMFKSNADVGKK
jgi:hypothetical protein